MMIIWRYLAWKYKTFLKCYATLDIYKKSLFLPPVIKIFWALFFIKGVYNHFSFFIVGSGKRKILLICNSSLLGLVFSSGLYSQTIIWEGKLSFSYVMSVRNFSLSLWFLFSMKPIFCGNDFILLVLNNCFSWKEFLVPGRESSPFFPAGHLRFQM